MKRRTYLKGLASVGAITTVGATGATAAPGDGDDVVVLDDPSDDNFGNGDLDHPPASDFYDGVWDLEQFRIGQDSNRIYFDFQMAALEDPFGTGVGWSHEYFQVYIKDPDAGSGAPTAESGFSSELNIDLEDPYHYQLLVNPGGQAFEDAAGNSLLGGGGGLNVSVDGTTVSVSVPQSTVDDISQTEVCVIVSGYDGYGTDGLRAIESNPSGQGSDYIIRGDSSSPKVMDMITPQGVSQSDALSTSGRFAELNLPYVDLSSVGGPNIPDVGGVTPTDTDGDGKPEDFDGDGDADTGDVLTYYENRKSGAVRDNPQFFDYDGDGTAGTVSDALELYEQLTSP